MRISNELYNIYQHGNQRLFPENIFEIENIEQLKEVVDLNSKIQLFYKGVFNSKVLSVLGKYILQGIDNGSVVSEKLFKIFIELSQNISFYSAEKSNDELKEGLGIISISYEDNHYLLSAGNIIDNSDMVKLTDKLKLIETLDRQGLRDLRRQRRHLERGDKGTANVGLIQVALTSENPLNFNFKRINDEYSFYSLLVTVNSLN